MHRYPDRVLLKLVHTCPVYCRFCFRREMVGPHGRGGLTAEQRAAGERDLDRSRFSTPIFLLLHVGAGVFRQGFRGNLYFGFLIVGGLANPVTDAFVVFSANVFDQLAIGGC